MTAELFDRLDELGVDALEATRRRLTAALDRAVEVGDGVGGLVLAGLLAAAEARRQEGDDRADDRLRAAVVMLEEAGAQDGAVEVVRALREVADEDPVLAALLTELGRASLAVETLVNDARDELSRLDSPDDWPAA